MIQFAITAKTQGEEYGERAAATRCIEHHVRLAMAEVAAMGSLKDHTKDFVIRTPWEARGMLDRAAGAHHEHPDLAQAEAATVSAEPVFKLRADYFETGKVQLPEEISG